MPFKEVSKMSLKKEFIQFAINETINFSKLCRDYNISRQTGYKWLNRFKIKGEFGLEDLSKKPKNSPNKTTQNVEEFIIKNRLKHPCWGAKKIERILENKKFQNVPSHTTINKILNDYNLINEKISSETKKTIRFEYERPNELWQMDFKGDFPIQNSGRCYPLTIIDDHSRFSVCVQSCENQQRISVEKALIKTFEKYGLPSKFLIDNGTPWATIETENRLTKLSVWLIELGIKVIFCRPCRPQTKGKNERFNRILKDECISLNTINSHKQAQILFNNFRNIYNCNRPHQSLNYDTPSQHYSPSLKKFTGKIDPVNYMTDDTVKQVDLRGSISFQKKRLFVGRAFCSKLVAVRPSKTDGIFNVFFYNQIIKKIDLKNI